MSLTNHSDDSEQAKHVLPMKAQRAQPVEPSFLELLQQFSTRYRRAVLAKGALLTALGAGLVAVGAWRLQATLLAPMWRIGLPSVAGIVGALGMLWWARRYWIPANAALHRIVLCRLRWDPRTRDYVERRTKQGLTKREIIRCLKRYIAREIYQELTVLALDYP